MSRKTDIVSRNEIATFFMAIETQDILNRLPKSPAAITLGQLAELLGYEGTRRTLQRHLLSLVNGGQVARVGQGRATRYRVPTVSQGNSGVSFSAEAESVLGHIRRRIIDRTPVGYDSGFLAAYEPNRSSYLLPSIRDELQQMGQTLSTADAAGTHARKVFDRLLIDLSWNSSRLEGNTYSLLETERLLEHGQRALGKDARDTQMILNHKAAIELLVDQAEFLGFNRYTILNLHALLSENLLPDPQAGGRLRTIPVAVGGSVFHPLAAPDEIAICFDEILAKASQIRDPFEQAFFAMVHIPYLQPFEDVNERVSRLSANIPLIRHNLLPISFVDVPQQDYVDGVLSTYELQDIRPLREVFVWAYRRSCARYAAVRQSLGQPDEFRLRYRDEIKQLVGDIVRAGLGKGAAVLTVNQRSLAIAEADRARFRECVESDLLGMHEGNFARYRVRPDEFEAWLQTW
jgi:hypothetical protein